MEIITKYKALPVSDEFLLSRLPTDNPITLMSALTENEAKPYYSKSRSIRVCSCKVKLKKVNNV